MVFATCAAESCPPPPPPIVDEPNCPRAVNFTSGSVTPACFNNDCSYYGWSKLTDGLETGVRSLAHTTSVDKPFMQLDLGVVRTDIFAVRLVSRSDCCLTQSQYVDVYLSTTATFSSGTSVLCAANVTFAYAGDAAVVLCPASTSAQYVIVQRNATGFFSLQEVQALVDGT